MDGLHVFPSPLSHPPLPTSHRCWTDGPNPFPNPFASPYTTPSPSPSPPYRAPTWGVFFFLFLRCIENHRIHTHFSLKTGAGAALPRARGQGTRGRRFGSLVVVRFLKTVVAMRHACISVPVLFVRSFPFCASAGPAPKLGPPTYSLTACIFAWFAVSSVRGRAGRMGGRARLHAAWERCGVVRMVERGAESGVFEARVLYLCIYACMLHVYLSGGMHVISAFSRHSQVDGWRGGLSCMFLSVHCIVAQGASGGRLSSLLTSRLYTLSAGGTGGTVAAAAAAGVLCTYKARSRI